MYLTYSLHFSPTRLFTTAVEKSSLPHFLTPLLSDSTFKNGNRNVDSTSLSHFTSVRLDFSQRQWKGRVYLTFSLNFCPTRLFTTAVEKSSLPHFLTPLLSDSTFHNGDRNVESTSLPHFTSVRLDFSQRQWKSRVYLTFSHFTPVRLDFSQRNGKVESTSLSHFTPVRLDFLQHRWKSRVYLSFSLHFCPTRLFTTAVKKSSPPHFFTSLLSDSTFHNNVEKPNPPHFLTSLLSDSTLYNGSGEIESTSLSHFTSLQLDFSQRQWKGRVYPTFSHFTPVRLNFLQRQWKSRV